MADFSENVVILHGLARSSRHMTSLARSLASKGYQIHNLDYPSRYHSIERLCEFIHRDLQHRLPENETIHFVGFSLGALLVRLYLSYPEYRPSHLGRVVQLAPPNRGSDLADFLQRFWLYKKFFGPAGQQVITDQRLIAHLFSPIDYELGVIAGTIAPIPIPEFMIKGENDGIVSVENTKVDGMREHVILKGMHAFFPRNKKVIELTERFLRKGTFNGREISK